MTTRRNSTIVLIAVVAALAIIPAIPAVWSTVIDTTVAMWIFARDLLF